jgi:hypothetical protein
MLSQQLVLGTDHVLDRQAQERSTLVPRHSRGGRGTAIAERIDNDDVKSSSVYVSECTEEGDPFLGSAKQPGGNKNRVAPSGIELSKGAVGKPAISNSSTGQPTWSN